MGSSVRSLLEEWGVEEEYVEVFEREKFKISTLKIVDEKSIARIIREEGPRIEFMAKLKLYQSSISKEEKRAVTVSEQDIFQETEQEENNGSNNDSDLMLLSSSIKSAPSNGSNMPSCSNATPATSSSTLSLAIKTTQHKRFLNEAFNLDTVLSQSINGKVVLSYYGSHHSLNEDMRNKLGDVIIADHLKNDVNRSLTHAQTEIMSAEVLRVFPVEKEDVWRGLPAHSKDKSIGRGKILQRYYAMRRKMIKAGVIQRGSNHHSKERAEGTIEDDINEVSDADENINDAIQWLKNNASPWSQVLEFWKTTSKSRISAYLKNKTKPYDYINLYPALKVNCGYLMFEIDCERLYPDSTLKLYSEWPMVSAFIGSKLSHSDKSVVDDSLTPDGKKTRTLLALNKLFPVVTAAKKGRTQWRPSRQESQEGFLLLVHNDADINTTINERRVKYEKYGITLGPQAIVVGDDPDFAHQCYLRINEVMYPMETPVKALDFAFKAMHALDCNYPKECAREWLFLQIAVYGFTTSHDRNSMDAKCSSLIEEYKEFKRSK